MAAVDDYLQIKRGWYRKALDTGYEPDDEGHEHMIDVLGDDDTTKK